MSQRRGALEAPASVAPIRSCQSSERCWLGLCGERALHGESFCSFETNPAYVERWRAAGLQVAARGADGEMREYELPTRRFFLATLFQPRLSSSYGEPHPVIQGYLQACAAHAVTQAAR